MTDVGEPSIFVQLALKVVMKNDRDFVGVILLYEVSLIMRDFTLPL